MFGALSRSWIQVVTFAMFALAARYLGVEAFGRFTLAMVFINIVQAYLYSGVYEFILKADPGEKLDRMLLLSNLGFAIIGAGLSALAGVLIGRSAGDPAIGVIAILLAPSALVAGMNASYEAMILRSQNYGLYNLTWVIAETTGCVVAAGMLFDGWGISSLIIYRYVQASVALLLFFMIGRVRFEGDFRRSEIARIFRFSGPIYFSRVVGTLSEYGADLVVGLLVSPAAAGIYRLASRIVSGLTEVILQPLRVVSWTRSSRAGRRPAKIALAILQVTEICATAILPFLVTVGFAAGPAITIGLGPAWAGAAIVVIVLMVARAISIFELVLEPLLIGLGRGRLLLVTRLASVAILFILLILTAPFGVEYVGLSRIASTAVGAGTAFAILCMILGARRVLLSLRSGVVLALGSFAVLWPIWHWLPMAGFTGVAIRIAALAALALLTAIAIIRSSRRLRVGLAKRPLQA